MARSQDSVSTWLSRIAEGRTVLERFITRTDPYVRAYNGRFPASLPGESRHSETTSNYVEAITRTAISNLFWRNPKVVVPHRRPEDQYHAHIASAVINRVIEETHVEEAFGDAMRDAILRGCGWLKLGYHSESAPAPGEGLIVNSADEDVHRENALLLQGQQIEGAEDENHDKHIAAHQALLDSPEILSNLMQQYGEAAALNVIAHIEGHKRMRKDVAKHGRLDWRVEPEQIWARYVDPRDVILDPVTRFEDVRWVAFRIVRPLQDVKDDPAYENTSDLQPGAFSAHQFSEGTFTRGDDLNEIQRALLNPRPSSKSKRGSKTPTPRTPEEDDDNQLIELFEVWDRKTEQVIVLTSQSDKFLRKEESPYAGLPGFFPLVRVCFKTSPGAGHEADAEAERPYGASLIQTWWPEQLELNKMLSVRLAIAKHNVPKYVASSSVPQNALTKLARGDVGVIVKLNDQSPEGMQKDPRLAVSPLNLAETSIDIHTAIASLEHQIQFKSGFSEIQMGAAPHPRTPATGLSIMSASSNASLDKMLDAVENSFQHLARIMRALVKQFYTQERVVALTGPEGEVWAQYVGADLYGDDVQIETKSSFAANETLKKHQALQLYSLLAANPAVKLQELTEYVLREHGVPTPARFLKSPEEIAAAEKAIAEAAKGEEAGKPQNAQLNQQRAPTEGDLSTRAQNQQFTNNLTF